MKLVLRIIVLLQSLRCLFCSRCELVLENAALRQQLAALKKENPRPKLSRFDRIFWVLLRRLWKKWKDALIFVEPETVVNWHKKGFKLYWKLISRCRKNNCRHTIDNEIKRLIRRMKYENPGWGAPRIHGELLKLGFNVCERSVSRYLAKISPEPYGNKINKWMTFIKNQGKGIAAMDFFVVPTLFFKRLYCFFIIDHHRRRIIHFNVTFHPTAQWVCDQLKKAFSSSEEIARCIKWMILDNDKIFSTLVNKTLKSLGIAPVRTSIRSPWQNGIAERWIGSCRRELLDHVIILNQNHLYRLLEEYIEYYHQDRTHYHLDKDPPLSRPVQTKESGDDKVIALPRVGGLHHKYIWEEAA
jgi:transposase InsO family protein